MKTDTTPETPEDRSHKPAADGWTRPESIPADVARKILDASQAIRRGDLNEAFHQLYSIASPEFDEFEPWKKLEAAASEQRAHLREPRP